MKQQTVQKRRYNPFAIISVALGVLGIVVLAIYLAYQFLNEMVYQRKWKDYDDCGFA